MTRPAFAAVGFDGAWALFDYVLPKAGTYDADAIREAAMAVDVPEGSLTQGWGVKFSDGKTSELFGTEHACDGRRDAMARRPSRAGLARKSRRRKAAPTAIAAIALGKVPGESQMYKIGIDVGGTFTDIVVQDGPRPDDAGQGPVCSREMNRRRCGRARPNGRAGGDWHCQSSLRKWR